MRQALQRLGQGRGKTLALLHADQAGASAQHSGQKRASAAVGARGESSRMAAPLAGRHPCAGGHNGKFHGSGKGPSPALQKYFFRDARGTHAEKQAQTGTGCDKRNSARNCAALVKICGLA